MNVYLHVCMDTTHVLGALEGLKRPLTPLKTDVIDGCKPLCGSWDLNLGLLSEQVFLTMKPSLQLQN